MLTIIPRLEQGPEQIREQIREQAQESEQEPEHLQKHIEYMVNGINILCNNCNKNTIVCNYVPKSYSHVCTMKPFILPWGAIIIKPLFSNRDNSIKKEIIHENIKYPYNLLDSLKRDSCDMVDIMACFEVIRRYYKSDHIYRCGNDIYIKCN